MPSSDLSFAALRRILLDLNFVETLVPGSHIGFKHAPSGTVMMFRPYRPDERLGLADLLSVRKQLDERGLMPADSFDARLRKASA
jgi:predicted RNA binding protein YcfA (HicA-like mRNA interferase family)